MSPARKDASCAPQTGQTFNKNPLLNMSQEKKFKSQRKLQGPSWLNFQVRQTHIIFENILKGWSSSIYSNYRILIDTPWPAKLAGKMI
jgi:hypothetical protein